MSDHPTGQDDRILYRGRKIDLALRPVTLADGSTAEREVVLHRGAVALLPMLDGDRVCLIRNRRYAIGKTLLEVPAGTIDPGEPPDACAARELREETGYVAGRLTLLTEWWVSPGLFTERMYLFRCDDLRPGRHALEPDEAIEPVEVPWDDAVAMALDGRIEDAKSMLAILYWDRRRSAPDPWPTRWPRAEPRSPGDPASSESSSVIIPAGVSDRVAGRLPTGSAADRSPQGRSSRPIGPHPAR